LIGDPASYAAAPGDITGFRPDVAIDVPRGTPAAARLLADLEPLGARRANTIAQLRAHLDARPRNHSAVYCARRSNPFEYPHRQAAPRTADGTPAAN
jgi:hypothetical protein